MSTNRIKEYPIPQKKEFELKLPLGSEILGIDLELMVVWVMEHTSDREETRQFVFIQDEEFDRKGLRYVGTIPKPVKSYHLFERVHPAIYTGSRYRREEKVSKLKHKVEKHDIIQLKKLENPKNP